MTGTRRASHRRAALCFVMCLSAAAGLSAGCGKKNKANELTGKVTYNGEVVTGGKLNFYPADGTGNPYTVTLNKDGTYVASGIPQGKKKVTVETEFLKGRKAGYQAPRGMKLPPGTKMPDVDTSNTPDYKQIPRKYWNVKTTTLECDVTGGKQEVNFDMTGKLP